MTKWEKRAQRVIKRLSGAYPLIAKFAYANLKASEDALAGKGPDAATPDPNAGMRAVVNIASVHVPRFCERSSRNITPAYLNKYDLDSNAVAIRAGDEPPSNHWSRRAYVDHALARIHGQPMNQIYYAAAELNGAGIRFYGDICFVLKTAAVPIGTFVLDRNSYDVFRSPFAAAIERISTIEQQQAARACVLSALSGTVEPDLKTIGAIKVLTSTGERDRRLSTGQISAGVLDDEDYIEILKVGSFAADDIQEVRVSAAEASLENHVERRLRSEPLASHEERIWLRDRRKAVRKLAEQKLPAKVVTTNGRTKY